MNFISRYLERRRAERRDAARYRWLRLHPDFETQNFLRRITPGMFDMAVDFYMEVPCGYRIVDPTFHHEGPQP